MKCPYCSKEINENALFCGFCGKSITEHLVRRENIESESPQWDKTINKKKHKGIKIVIVFCIISFISGGVVGLLYARGFVSLSDLNVGTKFKWTSHAEGETDIDETETDVFEDKEVETSADVRNGN